MAKSRSTGRQPQRGSPAVKSKETRFVSEDSTPERRKLNKQHLDQYLAAILAKRADRGSQSKTFQTWKNQEVGDVYKKRKPLIHLEENSTKVTNKFSREVQARNLELSVQACLWLCRKNQAATLESEEREKEQKSEERLQRASKEVGRSKTAALPFIKPKARDRFERKKTSDLRLRKSYIIKESPNTTPKESSGGSELSSEDKKLPKKKVSAKVKKTGRGKLVKKEVIGPKEKKRALAKKIKSHIKLRNKKYK